jgi:hypothetical protein
VCSRRAKNPDLRDFTLASLARIQTSKSSTRGAISFARLARRSAGGKPLMDRSRSKMTSKRLTASQRKAGKTAAAVSALGSTVCILIRRLNASCKRSIAFDVRIDFHWLFGKRVRASPSSFETAIRLARDGPQPPTVI